MKITGYIITLVIAGLQWTAAYYTQTTSQVMHSTTIDIQGDHSDRSSDTTKTEVLIATADATPQPPTHGWISIPGKNTDQAQCHIYDEKGALLYSNFLDSRSRLWIGDLQQGAYSIVVVDLKGNKKTIRFDTRD